MASATSPRLSSGTGSPLWPMVESFPWSWLPQIQCCTVTWTQQSQSACLSWQARGKVVVGNSIDSRADLSAPYPAGKPAHMHPSWAESKLPTMLLLVPAVLQPAKRACLPNTGSQDWGTKSVTWTTHSPGQGSSCVISFCLWVPLQGHKFWPNHISSLSTRLHVYLLQPWFTGVRPPVSS